MNPQFAPPQQQQQLFNPQVNKPPQAQLPPPGVMYPPNQYGPPPVQNNTYGPPPNRPLPQQQMSQQAPQQQMSQQAPQQQMSQQAPQQQISQQAPQQQMSQQAPQPSFPPGPPLPGPPTQQLIQQDGPRQNPSPHVTPAGPPTIIAPPNARFPPQMGQPLKPPVQPAMSNSNPYAAGSRPPPLPGQNYQQQQQNYQQQQQNYQQQNYQQQQQQLPPPVSNYPVPAGGQQQPLTNQMQNMSLDATQRYQYPPPGKQPILDGAPHMPPPLAQQQAYTNGQGLTPGYQHGPGAGMPPMPGGQPPMPGQPPMGSYPYQQNAAAQQKRLDPDQMPSPIQVWLDDQKTRSGPFLTNQRGLVPPLVTTRFVVQDQGNASPRYIRSTMYNVPISQDLMKQTAMPFGLAITPMARLDEGETPPPIVDFGELGPVRCIRCKAYMCPFMQFVDAGRRFQCVFCKATTDVPAEYFQHLDHTGQRIDRYERPELVLGTYEFVATKDYCRDNTFPNPPAFIFVIDVSYNNVKSGVVSLLCSQMKEIVKNLPIDQGMDRSNVRVGFITYGSSVHFYNIKGTLAAPQMMVVGDVQDMFMPLLDGFLCSPDESEIIIDQLMEQIPAMFEGTRETETILLPAILAGVEALKASNCTGKLLVFHSSLPIAEAPGKLKNRDDRKLLSTEKERTVLTPQNQAYNQLGQDCVGAGCSVDLFIFNNAYIDIATIGQVARLSGGQVYKYTYFQADLDGDRLIADIIDDVSRPIAFDAIMRVRTSTGVRPTDFYGHFYMSNTTDMELGAVDCEKSVSIEIKHDDKLSEDEGVYVQVALLYTSCAGRRRLRIINLSLRACSQMADLYRSCDLDTLINFFAKQSLYRILENNPKAVKDNVTMRASQILANYRKNCASPSSAGQLILPECMKLLPLYINCLLKSDALTGGSDMTVDDRSYAMQAVVTMDVPNSVVYFYPRLVPLHELNANESTDDVEIPPLMRCSIERLDDHGVYLLENGIHMLIWIGLATSPVFCQQVFGVQSAHQIDVNQTDLPECDNPLSRAVHALIDKMQWQRPRRMRLTLIRQKEKLEPIFKHFLVEDRGLDGSPSYVDFLCHMHKEIRTILS